MKTLRKHAKIMACYFRLNLSSALEYRASFVSQAFGMALSNSSFIFFWWVALGHVGGEIAGYAFNDVMFIWAVTSAALGLSNVLFANVNNITQMAVTGELDAFLLQPCAVLPNVLCARTSLSAYGDVAYGFVLMAIVYRGDVPAWLWFLAGALVGCLLMTAVALAAHTLTFYWGDASAIGGLVVELMLNFSLYPDKIYSAPIRALIYSAIPVGLAVHAPIALLRSPSAPLALAALGGAALYCAGACAFFRFGLRRYESGNAIVTRL